MAGANLAMCLSMWVCIVVISLTLSARSANIPGCVVEEDTGVLDCFVPGTKPLNKRVYKDVVYLRGIEWNIPFTIERQYFPRLKTIELIASALTCNDVKTSTGIVVLINGERCVKTSTTQTSRRPVTPESTVTEETSKNTIIPKVQTTTETQEVEILHNMPSSCYCVFSHC